MEGSSTGMIQLSAAATSSTLKLMKKEINGSQIYNEHEQIKLVVTCKIVTKVSTKKKSRNSCKR